MYVASVSSECCIGRIGVAHVTTGSTCCSGRACVWEAEGDGGRGMGGPRRVKRKRAPCMPRAWEAEDDGGRGARPCVHVGTGSRGGAVLRTGGTEVPPCARTRVKWSSKRRHPSVWALATSFMKTNTSRLLGGDLLGVQCGSFGHLLSINVVVNDSTKLVIQGTSNPPCAQKLKLSIFAVQVYVN